MVEKKLEDYSDVFADILNVLLFKNSTFKIDPDKIIDGPTESIYKADDKTKEQRRDTFKYYDIGGGIMFCVAAYGIENQSTIDGTMPVRIMNYDSASYKSQVNGLDSGKKSKNSITNKLLYPVITIVLNFTDKEWKTNKSLFDMMDLPEEMKNYVQDYKINVFDVAFLDEDTINKFTSDFKAVARFFKDIRLNRPMDNTIEIQHPTEIADLFTVFTGDDGFENALSEIIKKKEKGEVITVCTYTENLRKAGYAEGETSGFIKGETKGRLEGKELAYFEMVALGHISASIACNELDLTIDELKEKMANANFQFPRHNK